MRYPAFNPLDYTNFLRQLSISDETARLEALWNVISACQKAAGDTRVTIEMNDEDLFADNNAIALTTAEAAGDKTKLKTAALLVDYSPADKTGYAETRAFIGSSPRCTPDRSGRSAFRPPDSPPLLSSRCARRLRTPVSPCFLNNR